jgi:hypothetical protein
LATASIHNTTLSAALIGDLTDLSRRKLVIVPNFTMKKRQLASGGAFGVISEVSEVSDFPLRSYTRAYALRL